MKSAALGILIIFLSYCNTLSQNNTNITNSRQKANSLFSANAKELLSKKIRNAELFKDLDKIKGNILNYNEYKNLIEGKNQEMPQVKDIFPSKMWVPGEFEESQAVLVSWPSYAYDSVGEYVDPFLPGIGFKEVGPNQWRLVSIAGYSLDLFNDSYAPPIWSKLVGEIQKECQVWIRVANPTDTNELKAVVSKYGYTLNNYRFIYNPEGENAFWMRDFGPFGFYFGENDSLGMVGIEYYSGRPIDNDFTPFIAKKMGLPVFLSQVESEGGNFMTDGFGNGFYSNVLYWANADEMGRAGVKKQPWTTKQVDDEFKRIFSLSSQTVLPFLNCDGGTGHIDIYLKLLDDEKLLVTEFPNHFNNAKFQDYNIVNSNLNKIKSLSNAYGKPYQILRITVPTRDNGSYPPAVCDTFSQDARNFVNGLIVNKAFIFPSYSDENSGNKQGDAAAAAVLQKYLPGYRIIPIDSRALSPGGGAIHCITMQVPSENPVKIWHSSVTGYQELKPEFPLVARITNKSGIKSAVCKWRKRGETNWNSINMTLSVSEYTASIPNSGYNIDDAIEYFIQAETNNGKTASKPISAPDGYFTFFFNSASTLTEFIDLSGRDSFMDIFPNPSEDGNNTEIRFKIQESGIINITIYDNIGRLVRTVFNSTIEKGSYEMPLNINSLTPGSYFIRMESKNYSETRIFNLIK